jgi:predicted 2-oxoglutarate/Fe(II)-dependent dioxygenase YbiX
MFDITKLALKIPNFLTNKECDELINEFEQRKDESSREYSTNAKTNKTELSNFRVVSLNPNTENFNLIREKTKLAINSYLEYLDHPKYFLTEGLKNSLKYSHAYRIMKYKVGASIHPHVDYDAYTYGSITFNLNNEYEGGEFKFFNGNHTINLHKGDALIFPANYFWVHEVTTVTKGNRYSINSFIKSIPEQSLGLIKYMKDIIGKDSIENIPPEELLGPYN